MSLFFIISIMCVIIIVISGLATNGATKGEKRFVVIILLNGMQVVFVGINGIIFIP